MVKGIKKTHAHAHSLSRLIGAQIFHFILFSVLTLFLLFLFLLLATIDYVDKLEKLQIKFLYWIQKILIELKYVMLSYQKYIKWVSSQVKILYQNAIKLLCRHFVEDDYLLLWLG